MFHSNISRELHCLPVWAYYSIVGRGDKDLAPSLIHNTVDVCFILSELHPPLGLLKSVINVCRVCLYIGLFICVFVFIPCSLKV